MPSVPIHEARKVAGKLHGERNYRALSKELDKTNCKCLKISKLIVFISNFFMKEKRAGLLVEQYAAQAADVRRTLEQLGKQNNVELCDKL